MGLDPSVEICSVGMHGSQDPRVDHDAHSFTINCYISGAEPCNHRPFGSGDVR